MVYKNKFVFKYVGTSKITKWGKLILYNSVI